MAKKKDSYGWLIKGIKTNTTNDLIKPFKFGTVCMPTGTGKTSVMILNGVTAIKSKTPGQKVLIELASHRLNLSYQNARNFVHVLSNCGIINPDNTALVVNSSDRLRKYDSLFGRDYGLQVYTMYELSQNLFDRDIIIVVSCYKSHGHLANYLEAHKNDDMYRLSFWDEAHMISFVEDNKSDDEDTLNVDESLPLFDSVKAFSATPKNELTIRLNSEEAVRNALLYSSGRMKTHNKYLRYITPVEAILGKSILPVMLNVACAEDPSKVENQVEICINIMENLKKAEPKLTHKILVNCGNSAAELKRLETALISRGYKVYATCCKHGFSGISEEKMDNATIETFKDDVEAETESCFVLHIRQLIEGIDISCLTATVFFGWKDGNDRTYVQTIGRVLRIQSGDRDKTGKAKDISKRVKKYGSVYYAIPYQDYDMDVERITAFYNMFYNCSECEFYAPAALKRGTGNSTTFDTNNLDENDRNRDGFHCKIMAVYLNTADMLLGMLPYTRQRLPKILHDQITAQYNKKISGMVKATYNTVDWLEDYDKVTLALNEVKKLQPEVEAVINEFGKDFANGTAKA